MSKHSPTTEDAGADSSAGAKPPGWSFWFFLVLFPVVLFVAADFAWGERANLFRVGTAAFAPMRLADFEPAPDHAPWVISVAAIGLWMQMLIGTAAWSRMTGERWRGWGMTALYILLWVVGLLIPIGAVVVGIELLFAWAGRLTRPEWSRYVVALIWALIALGYPLWMALLRRLIRKESIGEAHAALLIGACVVLLASVAGFVVAGHAPALQHALQLNVTAHAETPVDAGSETVLSDAADAFVTVPESWLGRMPDEAQSHGNRWSWLVGSLLALIGGPVTGIGGGVGFLAVTAVGVAVFGRGRRRAWETAGLRVGAGVLVFAFAVLAALLLLEPYRLVFLVEATLGVSGRYSIDPEFAELLTPASRGLIGLGLAVAYSLPAALLGLTRASAVPDSR